MHEVKPVLNFDGEITPDDKLAIEIYTNADVDIKVKTNVVTGENGTELTDDQIVEITVDVFQAVLSALKEYGEGKQEIESSEDALQMNVYLMRTVDE